MSETPLHFEDFWFWTAVAGSPRVEDEYLLIDTASRPLGRRLSHPIVLADEFCAGDLVCDYVLEREVDVLPISLSKGKNQERSCVFLGEM